MLTMQTELKGILDAGQVDIANEFFVFEEARFDTSKDECFILVFKGEVISEHNAQLFINFANFARAAHTRGENRRFLFIHSDTFKEEFKSQGLATVLQIQSGQMRSENFTVPRPAGPPAWRLFKKSTKLITLRWDPPAGTGGTESWPETIGAYRVVPHVLVTHANGLTELVEKKNVNWRADFGGTDFTTFKVANHLGAKHCRAPSQGVDRTESSRAYLTVAINLGGWSSKSYPLATTSVNYRAHVN